MKLEKKCLAFWQSKHGRYWVRLWAETVPGCAAAFSYQSDNGGGYLGHCAPEVAMQHAAREAGYAPSKMPRVYFNEELAVELAALV